MNDYSRPDLRTIIRHRRNIATIQRHTNTLTQLALINIRENINTQIQEQLSKSANNSTPKMYPVNSPHLTQHENTIHSFLPPSHPISERSSSTPLIDLNSIKNAFCPRPIDPLPFLYQTQLEPDVSSHLPKLPPTRNINYSSLPPSHPISEPSSLTPLNGLNSIKMHFVQTY